MASEFAFDCLSITQQHIDNLNEMSKTLPISHISLIQELSAVLVPYTAGKFQLLSNLLKKKLNIDINAEKLQFIISLIRSDVLPSFSTGLSAKELIVEHSLLNKLPFFTPYQLIPFTDICPICNKKLDRNLAAEQLVVQTPEFNSMNVGCRNSPQYRDIYCEEHQDMEEEVESNSCTTFYSSESFHEQYNQLRNGKKMYYDSLSCKTRKSKPGAYISKTFRTLGVVTWTLNCNIIVSSTELVRSESIKEIINGLCQLVRFSQTGVDENNAAICFVPRNIVYDDGCHLLKAIIDHYGTNIHRNPATTFLFNNCKFSIDRLHYPNHRSAWCKENLNPDRNPDLTGINTGACEQTFSWFNKFAKSFSCMRSERCQLIIHLMFHYWNCRHVGLNPYHKDIGRRLLPENTTEEKNDEELFTQTGTQNTYYSESDDSDAHQEQLYELEDVEDDSDSNSSTPILASQTIIPNQSPLYSDDSRTSTNSHLPSDNISKRLSTTQQVLWEKLRNITCIDEFEKQLQSEDEEDDNSIDRRSTRIFNGLLFH
ncbi:unnamed protein product [Adineta steineri]|uniref:CxC5 like cysteine cluster associated with KDZ domain-containing protein n=1 Tax=Adineta steineri TaxID=433720 RepID=A0A815PCZ1_9BILA|nr:unnamed protein product [Adineta steineri]CAF1447550.1 unnamed protein product [Adineta steineri]